MVNGRFTGTGQRWVPVVCAVGVAFVLKLLVLGQLFDHPLLQLEPGLDTAAYVELARRVLAGDLALGPGLYYVSPLYIYFLALIYGLTDSFVAVRVAQIALGSLTVGCVFIMAREWAGSRAGWVAAALAAGCGVLTFHEIVLMQSALDPFLTACALTSLTMALRPVAERQTPSGVRGRWYFLFGLCLGIQALNRPQVLLPAVAIVVLLVALRRVKPAAIAAAGLAIAMLPVAARNVVTTGQWSLVSSHGGLNFYIGNHDAATGLYQPIPGIRPDIDGQREDTRRLAEAAASRTLTDAEVSDHFFGLAWQWIRDDPLGAVRLFGKKLLLSIHADHVALPHSFEFFANDAQTMLRWLVLNPWLIMPLGLAGLLFAQPRGSRDETVNFRIWAVFVPAYAGALAVFFLAERYRLPLLVPLCVGAGMFIDSILRRVTDSHDRVTRREWLQAVGVAALIAVVVNWPFRLADSRQGDRLRMVRHSASQNETLEAERWATLVVAASNTPADIETRVGRIYLSAGHLAAALRHFRNAETLGARGPELLVDIADTEQQLGDTEAALSTLHSIVWAQAPAALSARAGRLASFAKDPELAIALFRRATVAEPALAGAWAQLGFALLSSNRLGDAESALQEAVRLDPLDAVAFGGLAVSAARQGKVEEALRYATAALALDPAEPLSRQVVTALRGK